MRKDVYLSFDIEADGPIPGEYSMISVGGCVAGTFDGTEFIRVNPDETHFYTEIKPISDQFVPEALAVSGLDRNNLLRTGQDPATAMRNLRKWSTSVADTYGGRPVFAAWPASFDWTFVYWYLVRYNVPSPFGFSGVLDMKTFYLSKAATVMSRANKRSMPKALLGTRKHTHNALDDARGQADLLANMFEHYAPDPG